MIGLLAAAGIPLVTYLMSRAGSASRAPVADVDPPLFTEEQVFGPAPTAQRAPLPDPPLFTEEQVFGPAPSQPIPSKPSEPVEDQELAKAPPDNTPEPPPPPPPPPDPEASTLPPVPVAPSPAPMMPVAPIVAPPPMMTPAPAPSVPTAAQRAEAMLEELRAIAANPTPDALARLRDPAHRAAVELALDTVADRDPGLVALIRRLLEPLPTVAEIEATAPPMATVHPIAPPAAIPEAPPETNELPTPPEGYDPARARRIAPELAANITRTQYNYSRQLTRDFQRFAGITSDGVYGGGTRAALAHFGVQRPPRALFAPTEDQPYPWA